MSDSNPLAGSSELFKDEYIKPPPDPGKWQIAMD